MLIENTKINYSIAKKGDDFVGFEIKQSNCSITFPMGYDNSNFSESINLMNSAQILISALTDYGNKFEGELDSSIINENLKSNFPINACIFLIRDFLQNGYYSEKQKAFYKDTKGKIDWRRTIKQVTPIITNEKDLVFLDFIVQKSKLLENELITQIHKYCVWKAFSLLGFLYTTYIPQKPSIPFNKAYFIQVLKNYLSNSFSMKNNFLFYNMIAFLEHWNDTDDSTITIGTRSFEHIWEYMIDSVYGTYNKYPKEAFFPYAEWHIFDTQTKNHISGQDSSSLRPDTIFLDDENCFIIDAKYYRYKNINTATLPPTESTAKQIIYGEYIDINRHTFGFSEEMQIYNVFILPYNLKEKSLTPKYFGFSDASWKNTKNKSYYKIISVLLDTKTLMENYLQPSKLAKIQLKKTVQSAHSLKDN